MKKKAPDRYFLPEFLRKMLAAVYLLFIVSLSYAAADNDTKLITFAVKSENLNDVLIKFKDQTGVDILFNKQLIGNRKCNDFEVVNQPVEVILSKILEGTGFVFSKVDGVYVIKKSTEKIVQPVEPLAISGVVTDTDGAPLPGVTVLVKGTSLGSATDTEGKFKLSLPSQENVVLVFSFVGMQTKEVPYKGESEIKVTLQTDVTEMEQVVVTGIFTRKTESYTGAATTIKKEELQKMGNQNVLQSLKSLDPAFHIIENNDFGSDPNKAPQIQLRGQQSMPDIKGTYNGNPNQPLFILDGFETDITTVYDLDMNRVETIVLLKDAAAKAIYGAKAANGVVVIETRQPKAGKMRISYKGDLSLTIPDLTGYNLCDAREKYEVDKAHGRYSDPWFWEQYLNQIKSEIERGVDTDWLAQPLHTGIGHRHSLYLDGGDEHLRYGVDLLYNEIKGVMKGSDRQTFTGGITLAYRYKDLLFRNQLSTTLNRANDSPYGSFDEYAKLNPYWTPYDENGDLKQIAGSTGGGGLVGVTCGNPLWNASIGTKNFSKYTSITNNFYIEWQALTALKFIGRLGLSKTLNAREDFYPASHTRFLGYSEDKFFEKGTYSKLEGESSNVNMDITANYSLLSDKHQLFLNLNYKMEQSRSEKVTFTMVGFPNDKNGFITSGLGFNKSDYPPVGNESISREIGVLSALNYSYDDRYLADLSWRASASSRFGQDKRWGQFWSAGIGWNIHNEKFWGNPEWLTQAKIRSSVGYTGNVTFSPYQAQTTYQYSSDNIYLNGVGAHIIALGNEDLKWQRKFTVNLGCDLDFWEGRFSLTGEYFREYTKDVLMDISLPPSLGFIDYKENFGEMENKGWSLNLRTQMLRDTERELYWSLAFGTSDSKNKIKKITDKLGAMNDENNKNETKKPVPLYEEGESLDALKAVPSLGIDPETGKEVFVKKDGSLTTIWDYNDKVVCGTTDPKFRGTLNSFLTFKGISLNMSFNFQWGGQTYNQTLASRVEGVNPNSNCDRRVLYDRWKKPGDRTFFKNIALEENVSNLTTRFVQDYNYFQIGSISLGYEMRRELCRKIGLTGLRFNFNMGDIARFSSVKEERGLSYPFARQFTFSLSASL